MLSKAEMLLPSANNPIRSSYAMDEMEVALRTWLTSILSRLVIGVESCLMVRALQTAGRVSRRLRGVLKRVLSSRAWFVLGVASLLTNTEMPNASSGDVGASESSWD